MTRSTELLLSLAALVMFASPADAKRIMIDCTAQHNTAEAGVLPEHFLSGPGGVDMRSGRYLYSHTDLSIGASDGMKLDRIMGGTGTFGTALYRAFGSLSHNWDVFLNEDRIQVCTANDPDQDDYEVTVYQGTLAQTFRASYDVDQFSRLSGGQYSTLVYTSSHLGGAGAPVPDQYVLHDSDGSVVTFNQMSGTIGSRWARAASIQQPDGTTYTFDYDTDLRRVVSNRGYALLFDYSALGPNGENVVTRSCLLNLSVTALPAVSSGAICPAGVPTSTYSYTSGELTSFTDQSGVTTLLGPKASAVYLPGASTPFVTNTLTNGVTAPVVTAQSFADGRTYSYQWNYTTGSPYSQVMGGTVTDNQNHSLSVIYKQYDVGFDPIYHEVTAGPDHITDQLARTTSYNYCSSLGCPGPLVTATDPEQNKRTYEYDPHLNPITINHVAKPNSGLATIAEHRTYNCTADPCAMKPTSTTDANGNTTDFAYDPGHGGILSEMGPAPSAGAARPLKLTTWAQKYAHIKNSSGVLVDASSPVWVISTETVCQTAAGSSSPVCDTSAPSRVTTYQYGGAGTANNLWVRGAALAADGTTRLTCYAYDSSGNKISQTSPRASISVCP